MLLQQSNVAFQVVFWHVSRPLFISHICVVSAIKHNSSVQLLLSLQDLFVGNLLLDCSHVCLCLKLSCCLVSFVHGCFDRVFLQIFLQQSFCLLFLLQVISFDCCLYFLFVINFCVLLLLCFCFLSCLGSFNFCLKSFFMSFLSCVCCLCFF